MSRAIVLDRNDNAALLEAVRGASTAGAAIDLLVETTHGANKHWWRDPATGELQSIDSLMVPTKLMLIVSELAEAMEGHRKGLMDDKLPHRPMFEVEMADALIRLLDLAGACGINLGGAYVEKMAYNKTREDHTDKARLATNGKKY